LNRHVMNCADISRIINSDQVQSKLRGERQSIRVHDKTKKNPLTNKAQMNKINPFDKQRREILAKLEAERHNKRKNLLKEKRSKAGRAKKHTRTLLNQERFVGLEKSYKDAEDLIAEEERQGNYQPGDSDEAEDDE